MIVERVDVLPARRLPADGHHGDDGGDDDQSCHATRDGHHQGRVGVVEEAGAVRRILYVGIDSIDLELLT